MFRSFAAFLLIFAMLSANFSRFFIYAGFEINKKYIASALCENKDKPQMHCKGKCYLAKKVKQAEEKEKSQEQVSQKNHFQEAVITERITLNLPVRSLKAFAIVERPIVLSRYQSTIFQPPRV